MGEEGHQGGYYSKLLALLFLPEACPKRRTERVKMTYHMSLRHDPASYTVSLPGLDPHLSSRPRDIPLLLHSSSQSPPHSIGLPHGGSSQDVCISSRQPQPLLLHRALGLRRKCSCRTAQRQPRHGSGDSQLESRNPASVLTEVVRHNPSWQAVASRRANTRRP